MKRKLFFNWLGFFLATAFVSAQDTYTLEVIPLDQDSSFINDIYETRSRFNSPENRTREINHLLQELYEESYLQATFDSLVSDSTHMKAYLQLGKQLRMASLSNGNIEEGVLNHVGFRERLFNNKPFRIREIRKLQERLLEYAENSGYPFAMVKLDSFKMEGNEVFAKIFLYRNKQVILDSIILSGDAEITQTYIYNYLGLKPGDLYDESVIQKISIRIKELPFLQEGAPTKIIFVSGKARVYLYLEPMKASRFNFMIGFLPNPGLANAAIPQSKFLLTGDAQLNLFNPMGSGEEFKLDWRRYKQNTQNLTTSFLYPYLPLMPFGFELKLDIYKQDEDFLERTIGFGLHYLLVGGNYVKAYIANTRYTLLSFDTVRVKLDTVLPKNIDVEHNLYGLIYHLEKLDYKLNPRRGFFLELDGSLGQKTIKKNSGIITLRYENDPSFDFETLYDTIKLKSIQYRIRYTFDKYWPLGSRTALKTGLSGGAFISQNIFQNELFRIGGNRLLRGFDEESILAAQYHILTLEYRYLLDQNSYFYLFGDGAYVENPAADEIKNKTDIPYGFGTGMTFEVKAGIFSLSYALGSRLGNPISFRSAKIHFGYLNYF